MLAGRVQKMHRAVSNGIERNRGSEQNRDESRRIETSPPSETVPLTTGVWVDERSVSWGRFGFLARNHRPNPWSPISRAAGVNRQFLQSLDTCTARTASSLYPLRDTVFSPLGNNADVPSRADFIFLPSLLRLLLVRRRACSVSSDAYIDASREKRRIPRTVHAVPPLRSSLSLFWA